MTTTRMNDAMELNDELLCAYLDGELSDAERAAFETALAADAGARLRLERLREADAQVKAAYPLVPTADNDPLAAAILAHQPGQPFRMPQRADVHPLRPAQQRPARWFQRPVWRGALAASVAAAVVGFVSLHRGAGDGAAAADAALVAALDATPSGSEARAGDTVTRMVLSFRAADGRWCRVFDQDDGAREGLACNGDDGWQVLALESGNATSGDLRPAGSNVAIDTLMDRLGGSEALDAEREQALIQQRWKRDANKP